MSAIGSRVTEASLWHKYCSLDTNDVNENVSNNILNLTSRVKTKYSVTDEDNGWNLQGLQKPTDLVKVKENKNHVI